MHKVIYLIVASPIYVSLLCLFNNLLLSVLANSLAKASTVLVSEVKTRSELMADGFDKDLIVCQ